MSLNKDWRPKVVKVKTPKSRASCVLISLLVAFIVAVVYFYFTLPAINLHSREFYFYLGLVVAVYIVCNMLLSGIQLAGDPKELLNFVKGKCKIGGLFILLLIAVNIVGAISSSEILRAPRYRDLLTVETGDFSKEVDEISFDKIPLLDDRSAVQLGNRKLGELSDMVSQFEVSTVYTQINYQGVPMRVTYLKYGDFFKWLNNFTKGIPAYMMINMTTQDVDVVRLADVGAASGIKYSPSDLFLRNLSRYIRFKYPTFMFETPNFEVDDAGNPYWICPKITKTIGLFGGTDIDGAVLLNAVTGETVYYDKDEIPNWVDRVYNADLIMQQYDYHGKYVNGFLNSLFGQRDVTVTTEGYNYIALNDDVYMYTGITSVMADQSNIGFILSNQRTKDTKYYSAAGATEISAMSSAEGVVQHLHYSATFPLLLNIQGQPTYFMALKDDAQLVKMYALVNEQQYQIVATGTSIKACEEQYYQLLVQNGIITEEAVPELTPEAEQEPEETRTVSGTVEDIRSIVSDGDTYYFVKLAEGREYYVIMAKTDSPVVLLNIGDAVTITCGETLQGEIIKAETLDRA